MKKIIIFLIFLSNYGFAQITISGSSISYLNTTFLPVASVPPTNCYITFNDAGTNVYKAIVNIPAVGMIPAHNIDCYISRRLNYWYIESFDNYFVDPPYSIYYRSLNSSTDVNPPCITTWQIWTGNCIPLAGFSLAYTGTNTNLVTLSGTCASAFVLSTNVTPTYIQLPQLTSAQINAIASPKKGIMVFDVIANVVKSFNGATWQTLDYVGHVTLLR